MPTTIDHLFSGARVRVCQAFSDAGGTGCALDEEGFVGDIALDVAAMRFSLDITPDGGPLRRLSFSLLSREGPGQRPHATRFRARRPRGPAPAVAGRRIAAARAALGALPICRRSSMDLRRWRASPN